MSVFTKPITQPLGTVRAAAGSDVRFVVKNGVAYALRPGDNGYSEAEASVTVPVHYVPSNPLP